MPTDAYHTKHSSLVKGSDPTAVGGPVPTALGYPVFGAWLQECPLPRAALFEVMRSCGIQSVPQFDLVLGASEHSPRSR